MFDFIKNDGDYKAFQWFIDNQGPMDGTTALLTVELMWDFSTYRRENLALPIRNIPTLKQGSTTKAYSLSGNAEKIQNMQRFPRI